MASTDSGWRAASNTDSRLAETMATDWLATTQMNQVPLAAATTGRSCCPSTALHGTT